MSESLSAIMARLEERLRPHAVSAPEFRAARRKATDSPPPAGTSEGYPSRRNTNANRRNGGRSVYYRPGAKDYAGRLPATTTPAYGSVKPANGIRVAKDTHSANGLSPEKARATGDDNGHRAWVATRENLERAAGDVLPEGSHYPSEITRRGNLGPSPRY